MWKDFSAVSLKRKNQSQGARLKPKINYLICLRLPKFLWQTCLIREHACEGARHVADCLADSYASGKRGYSAVVFGVRVFSGWT
jgi:hypothetical protein